MRERGVGRSPRGTEGGKRNLFFHFFPFLSFLSGGWDCTAVGYSAQEFWFE